MVERNYVPFLTLTLSKRIKVLNPSWLRLSHTPFTYSSSKKEEGRFFALCPEIDVTSQGHITEEAKTVSFLEGEVP